MSSPRFTPMQHISNAQLFNSISALIVIIVTTIGFLFAGGTEETRNTVKLKVRNGLPNFFNRVDNGEVVRIAYLGGCITEAGGGWRDQTLQFFPDEYPRSSITQINAGIGGTGSNLGVFRLQSHVLDYDPHLVFIEFACNDIKKPAQVIIRSMEGLVRKIRKHNPTIEVCFVYTLSDVMVDQLSKDTYPAVVMTMEKVAEHYQIPSMHMGLEIVKLASRVELVDGDRAVTFSLSPQRLDKASILAQLEIDKKHNYDEQEVVLGSILFLGE